MAVHGGADREGAYLLPADSTGRPDKKYRLQLVEVLDRLAQIDKDQKEAKNKVLILDVTQISADWPLGILHNGFARELAKLESKIAGIPNLVVLSASGPDQRSWVSEEWRQTVFAHFVIEGLKGDAKESGRGRITALDLHNYVHKKVANWVRSNRDAVQEPVLLPGGGKGEDLAGKMDLVVVEETYQPPNPRELWISDPPQELLTAWKTFQDLEKETPSPAVYSPNLWRQYQEFLLRYEQMIRADDRGMASALTGKLDKLVQDIRAARVERLTANQNMLPMPAAAGLGPYQPDQSIKEFTKLWDAAPDDQTRVWDDIQKNVKADQVQLLRVQLGELLIKQVAEDPPAHLKKGAKLAGVLYGVGSPRPAEIHFLVMLDRDQVEKPQPAEEYYATIRAALELRLLAEKTALNLPPEGHPYAERVYPWIKSLVDVADESRRMGQDLLFASNSLSWSEARKSFESAKKKYEEAREIGSSVRAGLAARDRAYEILPALTKWAAIRRSSDDTQKQNEDVEILRSIEDLWKEVHRLDRQLEKPNPDLIKNPPKPDLDDPNPLNLEKRTDLVTRGLGKLWTKFNETCQNLANSQDIQIGWHETESALTVPFIEPTLRMKLIGNSRRISHDLLAKVGDKPTEAATAGKKEEEHAPKEAMRQGRMALANLGKYWFDNQAGELEKFESVQTRINNLLAAAPNWAEPLAIAEHQIGIRWQQVPTEIDIRANAAPKSKLDQALEGMEFADRLGRFMDAGSGALAAHDSVQEYRRLLLLGLLNWQAQRTFDDHWFDLDPNPDQSPYYRVAGSLFLDDARKLVPQPERQQGVVDLQKKLDQLGRLLVDYKPQINVTSEQKFTVTYRIRPPQDEVMPNGFPVARVIKRDNLEFVTPPEVERAVYELTGKDQPLAPVSVTLRSPLLESAESNPPLRPDPVPTTITLDGLYRGQRVLRESRVNLYPLPEIAQSQPRKPRHASLAVRADPTLRQQYTNRGAVAIVLDCSGSMWIPHDDKIPKEPVPPDTKVPEGSRFVKAVGALNSVLEEVLPQDAIVGLWTFSEHNKEMEEERITELWRPAPWDRKTDPQDLKDKIRGLVPYYHTPLVEAMWVAKNGLEQKLPKDFKGFKSIVVLTDGADDRFPQFVRRRQLSTKTIKEFMEKEFLQDSGFLVNMVFFQVEPKEAEDARAAFEIIEDKKWKVPGKMTFIAEGKEDQKELIGALRRAFRQGLRYWVENLDGTTPRGLKDFFEVSADGSTDQWVPEGLLPGSYDVWVRTTERSRQKIYLERGDLLLMQLNKDRRFERLVFSEKDYPGKIAAKNEDWRLAVLQNQKHGDQGQHLQMLTTLERLANRSQNTIRQVIPQDIWFEIQPPANVQASFGLRWGYQYGYPAATWGFNVPEWPLALGTPNLASPEVRVWWSDKEADSSKDLQGRPISGGELADNRIEGDDVVGKSVSVENHLVEVVNGQKPTMQSCLVVRMAYAHNKPVWAKVTGMDKTTGKDWNIEGFEHRFYQDANKYTGLFWPVPPNAAENLTKLSIISVDKFRQEAKQHGFTLVIDAKVPEPGDYRPLPLPFLK
jgi:hypothetical protein